MYVAFCNFAVRQAAKDVEAARREYEDAKFEIEYHLAMHPAYQKRTLEEEARFQNKLRALAEEAKSKHQAWVDAENIEYATVVTYYGGNTNAEENRSSVFDLLNGGLKDSVFQY